MKLFWLFQGPAGRLTAAVAAAPRRGAAALSGPGPDADPGPGPDPGPNH